ncbi:hypothetical protein [Microbacterium sp. 1P06AB]|uniref:hypothetical protein n=1 Tax=Microbacterium sp. 1P06AB TaxID=3132289 RepID=UPI0039A77D65
MADDFHELYELAADLTSAPPEANRNIQKALEVTARGIKDDWRQGAGVNSGEKNVANAYSNSIDYDMALTSTSIEAQIGPNLDRRGGSAGFLEDAPGGVASAPQHAGRDALDANEEDFVRGAEIAIFDALTKAVDG